MNKENLIIDDSEMMKKLEKSQNDKIDKLSNEFREECLEQKEMNEEYLENDGPLDDTEFFKKLHKIQKESDERLKKQFIELYEEYSKHFED